jgi:hypothetical protein
VRVIPVRIGIVRTDLNKCLFYVRRIPPQAQCALCQRIYFCRIAANAKRTCESVEIRLGWFNTVESFSVDQIGAELLQKHTIHRFVTLAVDRSLISVCNKCVCH